MDTLGGKPFTYLLFVFFFFEDAIFINNSEHVVIWLSFNSFFLLDEAAIANKPKPPAPAGT